MPWNYKDISAIHLELSTKCNAACPGCPRFLRNSPNVDPALIQTDITISQFKSWFPVELVSRVYNWIICGTHGDPITCTDLYEILEYICEYSPGNIQLNTNGGLRGTEYFTKIGNLFAKRKEYNGIIPHRVVTFSVDGLEDTNHIYRKNVRWHKVWENMLSYKATGAEAHWDFLQFQHNVHQVEQARHLAEKYDIRFVLKNPFGVDGTGMPVYDKDYNLEYVINHAFNPVDTHYVPAPIGWRADLPKPVKEEGCIQCMSFRNAPVPYSQKEIVEIYVDALGRVHPCCFVGNKMQGPQYVPESREMQELQVKLGITNNLNHRSLKEILDNQILEVYTDSWESKSLSQCWVQCGKSANKERAIDILFANKE